MVSWQLGEPLADGFFSRLVVPINNQGLTYENDWETLCCEASNHV